MLDDADEVSQLKARIDALESTLQLKNETLTSRYKLTPAMGGLLGLLLELPVVHDEIICERLGLAADAKVAIFRLRRHLQPYEVEIHSRRGTGWWLDDETKARISQGITLQVIETAA